ECVGKRLRHLAVAVEGTHVRAETARLEHRALSGAALLPRDARGERSRASREHRAVEGQRQIARELDAKRRANARHIAGDREWHRGDDLEARERLARTLSPALERRQRDVAHVGGRAEPEDRAVGDLARQLEHLAGERGDVDAVRRGQRGTTPTPRRRRVVAAQYAASTRNESRPRPWVTQTLS